MKKILILGSGGQIGSHLSIYLEKKYKVLKLWLPDVLRDPNTQKRLTLRLFQIRWERICWVKARREFLQDLFRDSPKTNLLWYPVKS